MNNRHILEQSLHHEILHHDEAAVNTLIDLIISKSEGPSLLGIDNQGRSFLNLALAVGFTSIADRLFDLQKGVPDILWGVDHKNRTLLSIAAKMGYLAYVEKLIVLSKHIKPGQIGYAHWLYADDLGNLPLHHAAQNRHLDVVSVLLDVMSSDENFINSINHINLKVNTPLHLACDSRTSALDVDLIALLINHQLDMTIPNENGETAFALIRRESPSFQRNLFANLNKFKQNDFLNLYRNDLLAQPQSDKSLYFTLAGMHSLKTLAVAKLEFDEDVEIRNFYHDAVHGESEIPDAIYEMVPLYAQRVAEAGGLGVKPESNQALVKVEAIENYQILNDDLVTFNQLIQDVERYLADLQARPRYSLTNQALAVLVAAMILSVYIGIEAWLGAMNEKFMSSSSQEERDQYRPYLFIPVFLFGIIGGVGFLSTSLIIAKFMCSKAPRVEQQDWQAIIDNLRVMVLDKLQLLDRKQQEEGLDCLPVPAQTVRDLENSLAEFQVADQAQAEVVAMLKRLDAVLVQIKQGIILSNKPLSLFFKPAHTAIEISSDEISENESELLNSDDAIELLSLAL